MDDYMLQIIYYNIPSNNRELQLQKFVVFDAFDYNIPSNNRELQQLRSVTLDK